MNLKIFETPRLRIRPSVWDDVETFFQWEQQPAVTEFFSIRDGQTMEETARKFLKDQENPNAEQFTIRTRCRECAASFGRAGHASFIAKNRPHRTGRHRARLEG